MVPLSVFQIQAMPESDSLLWNISNLCGENKKSTNIDISGTASQD